MNNTSSRAFTLLGLLITVAILAISSTAVLIIINPAEHLKTTRDAKRVIDIRSINESLELYLSEYGGAGMGSPKTAYISLPSDDPTCAADYPSLPSLPAGWQYHCAPKATYQKIDGTGWIPVNFQSITSGSPLSHLPVDPVNSADQNLYYTYVADSSWKASAVFESKKYRVIIGDLDGDGDVDQDDLNILLTYRNQPAGTCPKCDIDGDGTITVLDARKLVLLCTRPMCATE